MQFKPGDKVKFLNQTGGGVVAKIVGKTVYVAIEDGFEIPFMANELLKIDPADTIAKTFASQQVIPDIQISHPSNEIQEEQRVFPLRTFSQYENPGKGVFFAFVPNDQKWLVSGSIDVLLINHTYYTLIYNIVLFNSNRQAYGVDFGSVEPHSYSLLETLPHEKIETWSYGLVQCLFHPEAGQIVLPPMVGNIRMKIARFVKPETFQTGYFFKEKHFLLQLITVPEQLPVNEKTDSEYIENRGVEYKQDSFIRRHLTDENTAEIDLHIHNLMDESKGMNPAEILQYQLSYFRKCLQSAINNRIGKLVIIHGVGNGILKSEIRKELGQYDFIEYFDAPLSVYGVGATAALLRFS